MVIKVDAFRYFLGSVLIVLGLAIHWPLAFLAPLFGALFLLLNGLAIGNWLFIKNSWTCKFIYGLLFTLVIGALIGTTCFYLFYLNEAVFLLAAAVISLISLIIVRKHPLIIIADFKIRKIDWRIFYLALVYLALWLFIFWLLYQSRTGASIRSPWEAISPDVFLFYFFATFILFAIVRFSRSQNNLWLVVFHYFLSFSVTWLVYAIGFDFDPFIHRLNLDLIIQNGTLLPKPFYYIGQYSLLVFIYALLKIAPEILDKLLVPLLAAVYLPASLYFAFKDNFKTELKIISLAILAFLGLTYATFISTTPQSLANLLTLITILLSLYFVHHPKVSFWPLLLLVLMALSVHPLAGIPLFFFLVMLVFYQWRQRKFKLPAILHQSIFWEMAILGALALPIAFLLNSLTMSQLKVSLQADWLQNVLQSIFALEPAVYFRPFISLADLIYTYAGNVVLLVLGLATVGVVFIVEHRKLKIYFFYLVGFFILFVNYLLLKGMIAFFSLSSYEQRTYPQRVLEIAFYVLTPFIFIALYLFFCRVLKQGRWFNFLALLFLSLALTFSFYLSYPRVDKIVEDHGYSTSATDLKTVNFIETIQKSETYVVLGAQPLSAAALKELGYRYYYNDYFFYPVPTGGPLYRLYEDLAYGRQNSKDTVATARFLTGIETIYFVINDYWFDAQKIIGAEKETANEWFAIDGKNFIFKYSD